METVTHDLNNLFEQLGLPSSNGDIDQFIENHRGVSPSLLLHQLPFWNTGQATFLKQAKDEDADWAEIVDELDARLR